MYFILNLKGLGIRSWVLGRRIQDFQIKTFLNRTFQFCNRIFQTLQTFQTFQTLQTLYTFLELEIVCQRWNYSKQIRFLSIRHIRILGIRRKIDGPGIMPVIHIVHR